MRPTYVDLDPDVDISTILDTATIVVTRKGKTIADTVECVPVLVNGCYYLRVNILGWETGLYQLQTKIASGKYVYYGKRKTVRIGREL